MNDQMLTTSMLCTRYGRTPDTLLRWQKTRDFPRPVVQGGHGAESRWDQADVIKWEQAQKQAA